VSDLSANADQLHAFARNTLAELLADVAKRASTPVDIIAFGRELHHGERTRDELTAVLAMAVYRLADVQLALDGAMRLLGIANPETIAQFTDILDRWND
jgi:hypothetical protein